jgi:hypothetical protein
MGMSKRSAGTYFKLAIYKKLLRARWADGHASGSRECDAGLPRGFDEWAILAANGSSSRRANSK